MRKDEEEEEEEEEEEGRGKSEGNLKNGAIVFNNAESKSCCLQSAQRIFCWLFPDLIMTFEKVLVTKLNLPWDQIRCQDFFLNRSQME